LEYAFSIKRKKMIAFFEESGCIPKIKKTKNTRYKDEPFISIPVELGKFYYKDDEGKWKIFKVA
jgi:hypothetical protein